MAEEESDQEAERLGEELVAIVESPPGPVGLLAAGDGRGGAGGGGCGGGVGISSRDYCRRFCQVVEDYAGRWQVPLPQLQVLQTALCCFTSASASFPDECEHVQYVLSSLAVSFFELLLFFGRDEFYEEPLKDILGSFQECQNHLRRYGNVNLELVTRIIKDGGPWEDPVLQAVLKAQPASQEIVNKYLSSENPLFFELRARYLIACERIPEAMALIKSCINHPEISKDLYFHQALFTCLFMSPVEDQLFREHLLKTDCKSGIDIICNTEKEGKTLLALQLCESFLIPQLQNGDMYYIWELIFLWSKLQLKSNPSKQNANSFLFSKLGMFPVHYVEVPRGGIIKWKRIVITHIMFLRMNKENAVFNPIVWIHTRLKEIMLFENTSTYILNPGLFFSDVQIRDTSEIHNML